MRKALYILGSLEDADVEWMVRYGERLSLAPGQMLIHENRPIDFLFIVIEGEFSVRLGKTADRHVATLLAGEVLGEISFVDQRNPTASVVATQPSRVLGIPRSELATKLSRDQGFAARFYRAIAGFLADRLFATTSRLGYGSPDQDQDRDRDAIPDPLMEELSMASIRLDKVLRYLADEQYVGSFVAGKL